MFNECLIYIWWRNAPLNCAVKRSFKPHPNVCYSVKKARESTKNQSTVTLTGVSEWTSFQLPSIVRVVYREFVYQNRRRITENSTQFNQHSRKHMARRCIMRMREVRKDSWNMTVGVSQKPFPLKWSLYVWREKRRMEILLFGVRSKC